MTTNGKWTLDKRVPLALIFAVLAQTSGAVWWGATLHARVAALEERVANVNDVRERMIRVETNQIHVMTTLDKIDDRLKTR